MSWSINLIGKTDRIIEEIEKHSATISGQCKAEFDAAKPNLIDLVKQNFALPNSGYLEPIVKLEASGSGMTSNGQEMQRSCSVKIEPMYGKLCF